MPHSANPFTKHLLPGRIGADDHFLDLDLPIVELTTGAAGELRVVARGNVEGIDMGFAVVLYPHWEAKQDDDGVTLYWGTGAFERSGHESDAFLEFVAKRYALQMSGLPPKMLPSIPVQVVGLGYDPAQAEAEGANMKFLFHVEDAGRYAEVFTNINIEERFLEFHEKDDAYRERLVRALSEA